MLAAVILAAGGSSRMGQPKQLLKFRGTSLLRRAIDTALAVPTEQVIVVLGHAADALLPEVGATSATVVINGQWTEGVSTSLRGGLAAVSPEARGVFIYPADMPMVTPQALRELAHRQQVSGRPAAMSESRGVRGVPVFITRSLFPSLMIQEGDIGGAQYLRAHPESVEAVHFEDADIMRDVDRPEDYSRLLELDPDAELT
ncbi:MAG: nucleotidyltransferase family protein [Chloroflexi bacterium]|nr:nucleotidyltransferase family protein [Chloroflexota bacterium]